MDEFILIFRHEDGSKIASPEQMQVWMKQTMDWIGGITAKNKFVGGNGLPFQDAKSGAYKGWLPTVPLVKSRKPLGDILL